MESDKFVDEKLFKECCVYDLLIRGYSDAFTVSGLSSYSPSNVALTYELIAPERVHIHCVDQACLQLRLTYLGGFSGSKDEIIKVRIILSTAKYPTPSSIAR